MGDVYLDYNASTPIDPAASAVMRPLLDLAFGNPSSAHWASLSATAALERARSQVASLLGAMPDEIVFTNDGSEANNLALKGTFFALRDKGEHIITQATEHPAVLKPLAFLERLGATVTCLPVDAAGLVKHPLNRFTYRGDPNKLVTRESRSTGARCQVVEGRTKVARGADPSRHGGPT